MYAFGKASHAMATAAVASLQRSLRTIAGGVVVGTELQPSPYATLTMLAGDHPLPGRHSFTAAQQIGTTTVGMRSSDVAIVLLSGGASSLIAAPLRGISEADLGQLFELLLGSGLDIRAINAIRKRFTRWGAGRLALALAPARTYSFVISDVPGDDVGDVGSGPCTPDTFTVREVIGTAAVVGTVRAHRAVHARLPERAWRAGSRPRRRRPRIRRSRTCALGSSAPIASRSTRCCGARRRSRCRPGARTTR